MRPAAPVQRSSTAQPLAIFAVVLALDLDLGGVAGREQDAHGVGGRGVDLLGRQQRVVERVAVGAAGARLDAVGDGDGHIEDGVVVVAVELEVLADGDLDRC